MSHRAPSRTSPRGAAGRRGPWALLCAGALGLGGCRGGDPDAATAPSVTPPAPSAPVDRLASGELAPSKLTLLGLRLPRGMTVDGIYGSTGHASGDLSREKVSNHIRMQVPAAKVEIGAARTLFPRAQLPGQPADHFFRIEVQGKGERSELTVTRFVPAPPRPNLSEAEQWRRAGFRPDGTPIDVDRTP